MTGHYRSLIRGLLKVTNGSQSWQFLLFSAYLKILKSCWSPLAFLCKHQQRWLTPHCPAMHVHTAPSGHQIQAESSVSMGTLSLPWQLEQLTKVLGLMWIKNINHTDDLKVSGLCSPANVSAMSQLRDQRTPARWDAPFGDIQLGPGSDTMSMALKSQAP